MLLISGELRRFSECKGPLRPWRDRKRLGRLLLSLLLALAVLQRGVGAHVVIRSADGVAYCA